MRIVLALLLVCMTAGAQALDLVPDRSTVNFVSVKNGAVGEINTFRRVSGSIDDSGHVRIIIDLSSVDTGIRIRDQRITQYLFDTRRYPQAVLSATVDVARAGALKPGQSYDTEVNGKLALHAVSADVKIPVRVVALADGVLLVYTRQPLIVDAGHFKLTAGLDKLRQLAGLASIEPIVPVTFSAVFR